MDKEPSGPEQAHAGRGTTSFQEPSSTEGLRVCRGQRPVLRMLSWEVGSGGEDGRRAGVTSAANEVKHQHAMEVF